MKPLLAGLLLALLVSCHHDVQSSQTRSPTASPPAQTQGQTQPNQPRQQATDPQSGLPWMAASDLPPQGQQVYALIGKGGPFRYSRDGISFGNREGRLPGQPRSYYREYTVSTPGASTRGTRRIICGGQPVTSRADCYYTADHYQTFRRIRP